MALPHRLEQRDSADVDGVRHLVAHRHIEGRNGAVGLQRHAGLVRRHVRDPGGGLQLPQERRVRLEVYGDAVDRYPHGVGQGIRDRRPRPPRHTGRGRSYHPPDLGDAPQPGIWGKGFRDLVKDVRPDVAVRVDVADHHDLGEQRVPNTLRLALLGDHDVEPPLLHLDRLERALGQRQLRALDHKERRRTTTHDHPRQDRGDQPGVLDVRDQPAQVRHTELEASARGFALLTWEKIDFDHAARLSARPTDSISSGATSSTDTASNAVSLYASRWIGLAGSTGAFSRLASASLRPGIRDPPPVVNTRDSPPADRDAVARNAAARSTPTAISSPRAST